ncbi:MAG TPA: ribosome maturation factor RimM [Clostridia bacterium]|nr:ribosome maturation factor RimM [Clostridia bacterium]
MKCPFLLIGYCQRAHGVRGEVLVKSLTDDNARFFKGLSCYLTTGADVPPHDQLKLTDTRPTPRGLLLSFEKIDTREEADCLAGFYLAVSREDALALEDEDEFYSGDLIGAQVHDRQRGKLGRVTDILNAGSGDILVVCEPPEKDLLIPFRRAIVQSVDPDHDVIEVDLPQELFELYRQSRDDACPR